MKKKITKKVVTRPSRKASAGKAKIIKSSLGVTPLYDRVLVKPMDAEDNKTASGIIIPDTVSREKPEQGEVVAVGDGRWVDGKKVPLAVKVGDKIVFSRYGYEDVKVAGVEYYILKEESIIAILN